MKKLVCLVTFRDDCSLPSKSDASIKLGRNDFVFMILVWNFLVPYIIFTRSSNELARPKIHFISSPFWPWYVNHYSRVDAFYGVVRMMPKGLFHFV